ncbi:MAG: phosphodiester glycosidase family protein [Flavobacteriales bacterium]|nr:phosphodiester glycosidase family protein [Flavobacteriales bacterium]
MKTILSLAVVLLTVGASVVACSTKEEPKKVDPIISLTVEGYTLLESDVVQEGNNLNVTIPDFNSSYQPTDLSALKVTFAVKYGSLKNYKNGETNNFSSPVTIDVLDYQYDIRKINVTFTLRQVEFPAFSLVNAIVNGVTPLSGDVNISGSEITIKSMSLSDDFKEIKTTSMPVKFIFKNGTLQGFTNGTPQDYSNGKVVNFTDLKNVVHSYNVKASTYYVDKGPNMDKELTYTPYTLAWTEVTDKNLPEGIRLYSYNGPKTAGSSDVAVGYYAEIDPAKAKIEIGYKSSPVNIKSFYTEASADDKPIIMTNGGFFGPASLSLVITNAVLRYSNIGALSRGSYTYYPTRSAFGIMADGTSSAQWVYNSGSKTYRFDTPVRNAMGSAPLPAPTSAAFADIRHDWAPTTAIGGAPILVKDQKVVYTGTAEFDDQFVGNRARTAIGVKADGKIILLTLDEGTKYPSGSNVKGFQLQDLAMLMRTLGCVDAMNLDGGGSTVMAVNGAIINTPSDNASEGDSRAIPTVVMIKKK